jgi:hypothetical protein
MAQIIFLNERSHPVGNLHPEIAAQILLSLVEVLLSVKVILPRAALITAEPMATLRLGDNYSIATWLNDRGINRERARFLLSLGQQAPFRIAKDLFGDADPGVTVYRYDGDVVEGLGLAHLYGGLPVSFSNVIRWRVADITLEVEQLLENEEKNWAVEIRHASLVEHVIRHREWLRSLLRRDIRNGADVFANRAELFPHLEFGPGIEANLKKLQVPALLQVIEYLFGLNDAVESWNPDEHPAPEYPPNTTDESRSRKAQCYFPAPAGGQLLFTWHGRYTPGPGRIHFRLEHNPKRVVLGYIGRKIGA